jgi:hypothetical protein
VPPNVVEGLARRVGDRTRNVEGQRQSLGAVELDGDVYRVEVLAQQGDEVGVLGSSPPIGSQPFEVATRLRRQPPGARGHLTASHHEQRGGGSVVQRVGELPLVGTYGGLHMRRAAHPLGLGGKGVGPPRSA